MSNTTDGLTTAEQLAALPDAGKRYELVEGVLKRMSPAGGDHGEVAGELYFQITRHVKAKRLGKTTFPGVIVGRDTPHLIDAPSFRVG